MAIDHVHLLMMIPPKKSVSGFMGYLKGKSSLIIYQRFGTAKFQYRCREFRCRGYFVDTTGKNTQIIKEYIQNQLKKDKENMQLVLITQRTLSRVASNNRKDCQSLYVR